MTVCHKRTDGRDVITASNNLVGIESAEGTHQQQPDSFGSTAPARSITTPDHLRIHSGRDGYPDGGVAFSPDYIVQQGINGFASAAQSAGLFSWNNLSDDVQDSLAADTVWRGVTFSAAPSSSEIRLQARQVDPSPEPNFFAGGHRPHGFLRHRPDALRWCSPVEPARSDILLCRRQR